MTYRSLEKLFHMDATNERFAANTRLAEERRNAESSFRTGFLAGDDELFLAVPRELSVLHDAILRREQKIAVATAGIPHIAQGALIRSLVVDEVVCSNDLEGVYSTRRHINQLLETMPKDSSKLEDKRFKELARLYLELSDSSHVIPKMPEDIRAIYDRIMSGEDLGDSAPDGSLFRKGGVDVVGNGGKIIHSGLEPESRIISALAQMITIASSPEIPGAYGAAISHFIFEYTHPFYDGNGRTGRYLLALYLSQALSTLTALSVSRAIAESRGPYYRAFQEAERPHNHGELTPFVITLLEYVDRAQQTVLSDLESKGAQMRVMEQRIVTVAHDSSLLDKQRDLLYMLAQYALFGAFPDVPLSEMAGYLGLGKEMTRKHAKALEEAGLITKAAARPLRFELSEKGRASLGIEDV